MTTEEILSCMAEHELFGQILNRPCFAQLFNQLALKARDGERAAEKERDACLEIARNVCDGHIAFRDGSDAGCAWFEAANAIFEQIKSRNHHAEQAKVSPPTIPAATPG